jgi:HlyD family secretion protein
MRRPDQFIALTTAIAWSFFGNVKTKLNVVGVLLGGEIHEVVATSQGQLISLHVNIGDIIKEGAVIASIEQPELFQQIEEVKASLKEREFDLQQLLSYGNQDTRLQGQLIQQQRSSIDLQTQSENKNLEFLILMNELTIYQFQRRRRHCGSHFNYTI